MGSFDKWCSVFGVSFYQNNVAEGILKGFIFLEYALILNFFLQFKRIS